jgi:hypothetical protein
MGGTDDPSNLIELTIEQHAEAHFLLYLEYGKWQDYMAAYSLSGQMTSEEIQKEKGKNVGEGNRGTTIITNGIRESKIKSGDTIPNGWWKGRSEEYTKNIRKSLVGKKRPPELMKRLAESRRGTTHTQIAIDRMSAAHSGKTFSDEHKSNLSKSIASSWQSEKRREEATASRVGRKWYTNGVNTIALFDHQPVPEGYRRGRK